MVDQTLFKRGKNIQLARVLRIFFLRLHSEFQCLREVLKSIELGRITIISDQDNTELSFLQNYLNESTKKIRKIHKKISKKYKIEDIEEIAYQSIDHLSQGSRESLLVYLEKIKLQVFRKIEKFTDKMTQHSVPCGIVNINAEKAKEQLEGNKSYKEKIIEAIKSGGLAAFEKAIDHPIAAFFVEAIKSWLDKN